MHFYPRQGAQQISKFSEREIARYIQPPTPPPPPAPTVLTLKFPPTLSLAPWSLYCKDRMVVPNADINKNKIQAKIFVLQLSLITISIQINGRTCPKKCFFAQINLLSLVFCLHFGVWISDNNPASWSLPACFRHKQHCHVSVTVTTLWNGNSHSLLKTICL